MAMEHYIVGGTIKIQKNVFTREMLIKGSVLRSLMNWNNTRDFAILHPSIKEQNESMYVTIQFSTDSAVNISTPPREIFSELKAKLKDKIKGKVACRTEYSMYGGIFTFEIDLNSDGGEIEYVSS